METIDLNDYRKNGIPVFAGAERGAAVRREAQLSKLDASDKNILIKVPDDVLAIASSFFKAMFGESIRTLGEDGFLAKYTFEGPDLDVVIRDGIKDAIKKESPLS